MSSEPEPVSVVVAVVVADVVLPPSVPDVSEAEVVCVAEPSVVPSTPVVTVVVALLVLPLPVAVSPVSLVAVNPDVVVAEVAGSSFPHPIEIKATIVGAITPKARSRFMAQAYQRLAAIGVCSRPAELKRARERVAKPG